MIQYNKIEINQLWQQENRFCYNKIRRQSLFVDLREQCSATYFYPYKCATRSFWVYSQSFLTAKEWNISFLLWENRKWRWALFKNFFQNLSLVHWGYVQWPSFITRELRLIILEILVREKIHSWQKRKTAILMKWRNFAIFLLIQVQLFNRLG